ncbi:MAG: class I SAM-dependent methyltransferase [Opitutaceae bacterium]|jgi:SAM-dependent methyltransferase
MNGPGAGFDRLARWYRVLEFMAFGRDLERARFEFLNHLSGSRDILLLGEGDGRCAGRLAGLVPEARILCIDSSQRMVERASRRLAGIAEGSRVTFKCADALAFAPESGRFDAVATLFFLDCFDAAGVASIVARVDASLRPGAPWLFADFALPGRGIARLRARIWLGFLYSFFRLTAGLGASELPPSEEILGRAGWDRIACRDFQCGLVRSAVYARIQG